MKIQQLIPYTSVILLLLCSVASAERILCNVEEAVLCHQGNCQEIYEEGGYATLLDLVDNRYVLADFNKEKYEPFPLEQVEKAGAFTIYSTGLGGAVLKIANQDIDSFNVKRNEFVEVRISMLHVFTSTGTCAPAD